MITYDKCVVVVVGGGGGGAAPAVAVDDDFCWKNDIPSNRMT